MHTGYKTPSSGTTTWAANSSYVLGAQNGTYANDSEISFSYGAFNTIWWCITSLWLGVYGGSNIVPLVGMTMSLSHPEYGWGESEKYSPEITGFFFDEYGETSDGRTGKLFGSAVNSANFGVQLLKFSYAATASGGGDSSKTSAETHFLYNFGFDIPDNSYVYDAKWRAYGKCTTRYYSSKWRITPYLDDFELDLYYAPMSGVTYRDGKLL